jgi:DNA-binding NarL/FixJ family response regulator
MPRHLRIQIMPRPVTALIVDDEAHVHVYLRILLKKLGVETVWDAADGHAALEQAAAHKPDVVLLDINLPLIGGLEVLAKLKAAHPKMPVIVISVVSKPETLVQAHELGADAYVLKHYPIARVLQMLSEAFDNIAGNSGCETVGNGEKPAAPV